MNGTRIAVAWPRPRQHRWRQGRTAPAEFPDGSDGLLFLEDEGFQVSIEESTGLPMNPLVRMHEFYSGLDPARAVRMALHARRYDAFICIGDASALGLVWLKERFGMSQPIIAIDPALSYDYPRRRRLQDYVLPRVDRVVVFGRTQLEYLEKEYGSAVKARFLPHRADVDFYRPLPPPDAGNRPYILSVGNDVSRDFGTLARAAGHGVSIAGANARFVVQTTRPVEDATGALEIQRETVSHAGLRALYAGASVVVLPLFDKIHAGGINTLLEAMAMACPLVVSASRGIADYVQHGENAMVVGVGDADAMAQAIDLLVRSPAEGRRLGSNARRFVVECCDNRVYAKRLAHVIGEALVRL